MLDMCPHSPGGSVHGPLPKVSLCSVVLMGLNGQLHSAQGGWKFQISHNAVELHFESVDECAWVWLNGVYIGQHDLGTSGWQTPFSLDITKEVKWDAENVIVVRILDTAGAGGIYKPVHLQVLE